MSSTYGEYLRLSIFGQSHGPAIGMTLDGIPYIGQYSKRTPDLYVSTGFNKWGMTSAMVSAQILTDLIVRGASPDADIFSLFQPDQTRRINCLLVFWLLPFSFL